MNKIIGYVVSFLLLVPSVAATSFYGGPNYDPTTAFWHGLFFSVIIAAFVLLSAFLFKFITLRVLRKRLNKYLKYCLRVVRWLLLILAIAVMQSHFLILIQMIVNTYSWFFLLIEILGTIIILEFYK